MLAGSRNRVFVIAEAGVNHNGDPERALNMVEAAARAGADAVKFQTFRAELLASPEAPKAPYQARTTDAGETQIEMLRRLELDERAHRRLASAAKDAGIEFMSTPFDLNSLELLLAIGIRRIKIASGDITNGPLLLRAARSGLPTILSTGMALLGEVRDALGVLAWGYRRQADPPSLAALRDDYARDSGGTTFAEKVMLLQCASAYPAPPQAINLRAMDTLANTFRLAVGLSDHSVGIAIAIAAAGRGAAVIEKHFTLDRTLPGPDHAASIEPDELAAMIRAIREVERAMGNGRKEPAEAEQPNIRAARRGLIAARDIAAGTPITVDMFVVVRPATGISPIRIWDFLGKPAARTYRMGEPID
ncbi:MAG: N-acetylneuraminate synthase [Alphaproteobacteria bacterium]|nr:N-acetylneuraminate synthase [Alphaproteobacteria bacterium]